MHKRSVDFILVVGLRPQDYSSNEILHVACSRLVVVSYKQLLDLRVCDRLSMIQHGSNFINPRSAVRRYPTLSRVHCRWRRISYLLIDCKPNPSFKQTVWLRTAFAETSWQRIGQKINVRNHQSSFESYQEFKVAAIIVPYRHLLEGVLVVLLQLLGLLRNTLVPCRVIDLVVIEAIRQNP